MRILFVTASYLPTINGVSYQISILKQGLEKLGHKVFVLAPSFPGYKDIDRSIIRYPSLPNPIVKKYPVGLPLLSSKNIKKIRPDIIHTHHPSIIGQFASLLATQLNVPLFFTAHTQYEKYLHLYFPHGKKITSKILNSGLKGLAEKCFAVVCPSINIQTKLKKNGIKNTIVIHNSIEENFFRRPGKKIYKTPALLFVGRLDKEKDPMFLIAIAKEFKKKSPNFKLLILGEGLLSEKMQHKIIKENLQQNVILAGDVPRTILPNIFRTSHIFITPSTTEVMPLSVLEAMAYGLPIITLENSGLQEIVVDGKTGYFLQKNAMQISNKIHQLFKNPEELQTLSKNAYTHALKFSVALKSKELEKLYKTALINSQ